MSLDEFTVVYQDTVFARRRGRRNRQELRTTSVSDAGSGSGVRVMPIDPPEAPLLKSTSQQKILRYRKEVSGLLAK